MLDFVFATPDNNAGHHAAARRRRRHDSTPAKETAATGSGVGLPEMKMSPSTYVTVIPSVTELNTPSVSWPSTIFVMS